MLNHLIQAHELTYVEMFIRIGVAILIGCVVGVEREYKNRPAGLRTHVLVCLGACMIAVIESLFTLNLDSVGDNVSYNFGRLCAQVISGIGFLGAGTIFTSHKKSPVSPPPPPCGTPPALASPRATAITG